MGQVEWDESPTWRTEVSQAAHVACDYHAQWTLQSIQCMVLTQRWRQACDAFNQALWHMRSALTADGWAVQEGE